MPAGANYENNTYQTDPPSYEMMSDQQSPMMESGTKYKTYEAENGAIVEFTPERRKKMVRNLYIILSILIIVYIIWIAAIVVSVCVTGDSSGY
ncbi:unnamed protein product [Ambrosiozyma monospora]|uniref:Unnamed protein product n=1 Tax=Ambrosiozyma monospora TaxID=43982 RepID=A0A9W6TAW6_AMBMO|nr:unnamed protein product [Ambrosiozyma monospora]